MLFLPDLPARRRWITSPLQLNEKIMHFFPEGRGARLPTARRLPDGLGTIAAVTVSARQQRPQVHGDVQIPSRKLWPRSRVTSLRALMNRILRRRAAGLFIRQTTTQASVGEL